MRALLFALLVCGLFSPLQGETLSQWLEGAPTADITFTPWDGDVPGIVENGAAARPLAQRLYGHLDLSRLPAASFPLKLRLLYDPIDSDSVDAGAPGTLSQPKNDSPAAFGQASEEITVPSPSDAHAIAIWTIPAPVIDRMRSASNQESVRAEIYSHSGQLLARRIIGAAAYNTARPHALLVNTPAARDAFVQKGYQNISEATKLVPDSYGLVGVDFVWIDATTANDPALTDDYWREAILSGTKIAGVPTDIAVLSKRLGVPPDQPVLLGGLAAAGSPAELDSHLNASEGYNIYIQNTAGSAFAFRDNLGAMMHRQLLDFSYWYLLVFILLQAAVVAGAFSILRGSNRVWIWLIVPAFALLYAVIGVLVSRGVVSDRSDSQITQVEFAHEGWPEAVLLTHLEQICLQGNQTNLKLPSRSRPFVETNLYSSFSSNPISTFSHDAAGAKLTYHSAASARPAAAVRSIVPATPPCTLTSDGHLDSARDFFGAWLWDGTTWHDLGALRAHGVIDWKNAATIHPPNLGNQSQITLPAEDTTFPSELVPLITGTLANKIGQKGDAIFLGAERVNDPPLASDRDNHVAVRRVIAYQFHLGGGTP